jgi:V/A-type H+-transporting ATPase subunit I
MSRPDHALSLPARMVRVAIVAPAARLRDALVEVADSGAVELAGTLPSAGGEALEALRRLERVGKNGTPEPMISPRPIDPSLLERARQADLLAGEVELARRAETAVGHGSFAALVGWTPEAELEPLTCRLAPVGATVVELPRPGWLEPPTLIARTAMARPFRPLVESYGSARYADIDPTLFAAISFALMFGMMFGDVAHGLMLAGAALALRSTHSSRLAPLRRAWPVPFAAGLSAALFGLFYGELFGPTGLAPRLWLDPVEDPIPLLAAALAVGTVLLAISYAIGTANRWRESGANAALVAPSGVAGTCVFLGGGVAFAGWYLDSVPVGIVGGAIAVAGLVLLTSGFLVHAGRGGIAFVQTGIEVVDAVVRIGSSVISFTRLAAFGLMHAAIGAIVWAAAVALWGGLVGTVLAALVFVAGNVFAFSLELLVAGIQAVRLEYYELFSRVFAGEGHAFTPWHVPRVPRKEES